jgi:hypothetical protein
MEADSSDGIVIALSRVSGSLALASDEVRGFGRAAEPINGEPLTWTSVDTEAGVARAELGAGVRRDAQEASCDSSIFGN